MVVDEIQVIPVAGTAEPWTIVPRIPLCEWGESLKAMWCVDGDGDLARGSRLA